MLSQERELSQNLKFPDSDTDTTKEVTASCDEKSPETVDLCALKKEIKRLNMEAKNGRRKSKIELTSNF